MAFLVILATLPVVAVGFAFKDFITGTAKRFSGRCSPNSRNFNILPLTARLPPA